MKKASIYKALVLVFITISSAHSQVLRKNIDDLTPTELATYEHAIQILRDRSAENPYVLDGYAWQAWVHNLNRVSIPKENELKQGNQNPTEFYEAAGNATYADGTYGYPGMCEHAKDLFFLWHRAQFYYFEKILQNTDPEGTIRDSKGNMYPTKNLGVPFWNFTAPPSGSRFPKVFEDTTSVLYHAGRASGTEKYPFTSPYLLANLAKNPEWPVFGGYIDAMEGGYGTFESQMHNPMHSDYIGGDMAVPTTAAYDPIFYSFHSYIDFVLEHWIKEHGASGITSLDYFLRGQQPKEFNLPDYDPGLGDRPNMGRCELYLDIEKLGYQYEIKPADSILSLTELNQIGFIRKRPLEFGRDKESLYYRLVTTDATFEPQPEANEVASEKIVLNSSLIDDQYKFVYKTAHPKDSYQVDVYLHPENVKANVSSLKFRKKYFANFGVAWIDPEHGADHSDMGDQLNIDLREVLNVLYKKHDGETWILTSNKTNLSK